MSNRTRMECLMKKNTSIKSRAIYNPCKTFEYENGHNVQNEPAGGVEEEGGAGAPRNFLHRHARGHLQVGTRTHTSNACQRQRWLSILKKG